MHNEYKKIVIGFDALPFNNEGIVRMEGQLIAGGFGFQHSTEKRELTVWFANKRELETITGILKI